MPQSSHRRQSLPELAKDVPGLNKLKDLLGFFNTGKRDMEFLRGARNYVATYKSIRGVSGASLNRWKENRQRKILREMVDHFLARDGNGSRYWPDDTSSKFYGRFQYSRDSAYLRVILNQFFFKMNQQARNRRPKKTKARRAPDHSLSTARSIHVVNPRRLDNANNYPQPGVQTQTTRTERANAHTTPGRPSSNSRREPEGYTTTSFGLRPDEEHQTPAPPSMSPLTTPASSPILGSPILGGWPFEALNTNSEREDGPSRQDTRSATRAQAQQDTSRNARSSSGGGGGSSTSRRGDRPALTSSTGLQHRPEFHHSVPHRETDFLRPNVLASVESGSNMAPANAPRASAADRSWNGPTRDRVGESTIRSSHFEARPPGAGSQMLGLPMRESSVLPDNMQGYRTRRQPVFATPDTGSPSSDPRAPRCHPMSSSEAPGDNTEKNLDYQYRFYVTPRPDANCYWPIEGSFHEKSLNVLVGDMRFFFNLREEYSFLYFRLLDAKKFYFDRVNLDNPDEFILVRSRFDALVTEILQKNPTRLRTFCMELQLQ